MSPLRRPALRPLPTCSSSIQLANAVGVWMHVVAAQWILTEAGRSATEVAAVPAAMSLPFFLLCLPFGALAGRISRRSG